MKKYTKIRRLGHKRNSKILDNGKLILKEKLDGANFRFTVNEDGQFVFGSKNVEYKIDGEPDYSENVDGRFKDAIEFVRENCDAERIKDVFGTHYTFFAENMVAHSLEYEWEEIPQVIGFDVYNHEKEQYLAYNEAYSFFESIGIETAPIVDKFRVGEFDPESYEIPESNWRDGKMEGVVLINREQDEDERSGFSTRAKMVTDEFAEKHKKATGANQSKEAVNGHEKVVSKYCTDGRIRKHIEKMRDEGRDLGMELMANQGDSSGLPIRIAADIVEEEADDIITRNDEMDWKAYRSLVADRCVYVLRQEIQKNATEAK